VRNGRERLHHLPPSATTFVRRHEHDETARRRGSDPAVRQRRDRGGAADGGRDTVRIVDEEVTVSDATLTVSNTTITGTGLPDTRIEDRTYELETTAHVDGLDVEHDGTTYVVCDVTIHVDDVGVHVQDLTLSNGQ
jgi:hypothetical protein